MNKPGREPPVRVLLAGQTRPALPQHDPGPAQPAWLGFEPQQDVSPGPGKAWAARPVSELDGDMSLTTSLWPHSGQTREAPLWGTMTSLVRPHF
jgi:hypothetical protein